ncbi:hypothetical protein DASC09_047670 [Saccharomycopsis crataegensis]|uniref:Major facilitator superfamily (MFS) profile domain-containing protein n=1 Tax=Saccharomycopsis crataegensis TaxID=43959 RepID=A0AAV5QS88_9ASCO|nr:hypothetical protein DASC09_047670 [Saccharomycopsis crataegensis]
MSDKNNLTEGGNAAFHNYINDFADIEDPMERRRLALEKMDNEGFGLAQVKIIVVAGVGFLCDAYDIFAINLGVTMLAHAYWGGKIPASTETLLKVSTSIGTVIGQISFGILGDVLGRKGVYGLELIIMISACLIQCVLGESPAINFSAIFTFCRIIMGIGIGGDYPLSSIITSEFSTTKWRGAIMGAVFANQGWGQLLAGLVALCCVSGFRSEIDKDHCDEACIKACDMMWRIVIGFGCVPACCALYFRLTIPESPRYTMDIENDIEKGAADTSKFTGDEKKGDIEEVVSQNGTIIEINNSKKGKEEAASTSASFKDFCRHFGQWRHGKILLGTAGCWFMLDVAYYGIGLNSATILQAIGFASSENVYKKLYNSAAGNLIMVCAGSIPGYWFSVFTIDPIGRKPLQVCGFAALTILLFVIGGAYHKLSEGGLLALRPIQEKIYTNKINSNATTFIIPGEIYPTAYRSSAHGISAASGKLGAIVAQCAIGTLVNRGCSKDNQNCFLPQVMMIFGAFMGAGTLLSTLIPETKRKTLEQLAEELHGEVQYHGPSISAASD